MDYIYSSRLFIEPLTADNNSQILILDTGKKNIYEGPDYLNAIIIVNGIECYSDVELDCKKEFWFAHKHDKNPLYLKVGVQLYFDSTKKFSAVSTSSSSTPPVKINISNQLVDDISIIYKNWLDYKTKKNKLCNIFKITNKKNIYNFIIESGQKNICGKLKFITDLFNEYGFHKSLLIIIARSLGYSANKNSFTILSRALDINFLKELANNFRKKKARNLIEEYILHLAGLKASNFFNNIKSLELAFKILKSRPANNFSGRIKMLSALITNIIFLTEQEIIELLNANILIEKKRGIFFNIIFEGGIIPGKYHQDIIIANSLLPFLVCYFRITGDVFLTNKTMNILNNFPGCLINTIITGMLDFTGLDEKIINANFINQLGLLYVADNFCFNFSTIKSGTNSEILPP